ncbi:transposase [Streptomyces sp. NBC_01198]|uniref:transposase n=1 Tax=Streptomyces sp. NBC_01198 TaxID=2903769 RepID=UPI002E13B24D|nr:transposase [Streptomyces sp. NBC_01198]
MITDVTTTRAPVHDTKALPGILANLDDRSLLSKEHFVDGGYLSVALKQQVAREHGVGLVGPIRARSTRQFRKGTVFHREVFTIDWDAQQVTCSQGKVSRVVDTALPRALRQRRVLTGRLPAMPSEGRLYPHRRPEGLLPPARSLRHPVRVTDRAADPEMLSRYALRAAIESTISEFVNGHGMHKRRYRSEEKTHVQHVLTAIAVNPERIDANLPPAPARQPRNPTALQDFLDWQHIPRPRSWRVATHPRRMN